MWQWDGTLQHPFYQHKYWGSLLSKVHKWHNIAEGLTSNWKDLETIEKTCSMKLFMFLFYCIQRFNQHDASFLLKYCKATFGDISNFHFKNYGQFQKVTNGNKFRIYSQFQNSVLVLNTDPRKQVRQHSLSSFKSRIYCPIKCKETNKQTSRLKLHGYSWK